MGSTRLVSGTGLASKLPSTAATLMESAKLVLLILPASMQLVIMHQLIRVSRTVCVTHVPVHLMTQVSLTSVVTNWTLENCWTSSRISSSPRLATKTSVADQTLCCSPGPLVRGGFNVFEKKISVLCEYLF